MYWGETTRRRRCCLCRCSHKQSPNPLSATYEIGRRVFKEKCSLFVAHLFVQKIVDKTSTEKTAAFDDLYTNLLIIVATGGSSSLAAGGNSPKKISRYLSWKIVNVSSRYSCWKVYNLKLIAKQTNVSKELFKCVPQDQRRGPAPAQQDERRGR